MASDKPNENASSKVSMSDKTEIATSISSTKSNDSSEQKSDKTMTFIGQKKKTLVTAMPDDEEEAKSSLNTRGIPRAVYLENPYDIIYKNQQERYMKEVEDVLGKYRLMENQLVKQKVGKIGQQEEMKKNIQVCQHLKEKQESGASEIRTQFEVADQLYSEGTIKEFETVAIWLGADVMMEFPVDEAIAFLEKRVEVSTQKIQTLQRDLDFTRTQINIVEVNRSRVYNAGVKVKKARETAAASSDAK
mmetsp:Transcript_7840/g.12857  ORF Transcript_7840/g.12857 Transcript_7840/m.12857 type:complete len:247 (+) Transcript_7840:74-814(+)